MYGGLSAILDAEIGDYNLTSALFTGFKVESFEIVYSISWTLFCIYITECVLLFFATS